VRRAAYLDSGENLFLRCILVASVDYAHGVRMFVLDRADCDPENTFTSSAGIALRSPASVVSMDGTRRNCDEPIRVEKADYPSFGAGT